MVEENWHEARLIPTSGINGAEEQERRATSALLAVVSVVKEFLPSATWCLRDRVDAPCAPNRSAARGACPQNLVWGVVIGGRDPLGSIQSLNIQRS